MDELNSFIFDFILFYDILSNKTQYSPRSAPNF